MEIPKMGNTPEAAGEKPLTWAERTERFEELQAKQARYQELSPEETTFMAKYIEDSRTEEEEEDLYRGHL